MLLLLVEKDLAAESAASQVKAHRSTEFDSLPFKPVAFLKFTASFRSQLVILYNTPSFHSPINSRISYTMKDLREALLSHTPKGISEHALSETMARNKESVRQSIARGEDLEELRGAAFHNRI